MELVSGLQSYAGVGTFRLRFTFTMFALLKPEVVRLVLMMKLVSISTVVTTFLADFQSYGHRPKPIWLLHAAAPDVSSSEATDLRYKIQRHSYFRLPCENPEGIPVDSFTNVHKRIHDNILEAAMHLELTDLVHFPFGPGAFTRGIRKQDSRFLHLSSGICFIQAHFRRSVAQVWVAA